MERACFILTDCVAEGLPPPFAIPVETLPDIPLDASVGASDGLVERSDENFIRLDSLSS